MRKLIISSMLAGAAFAAQPAQAALNLTSYACSAADIGMAGNASFGCVGFYSGNLSSDATSADQTAALALLGLNLPNAFSNAIKKVESAPYITSTSLDFSTMMYGITYIAVKFGRVPDGPGRPDENNVTAFYRFDAGDAGIDVLSLGFKSGSNATLYATGTAPIPEPATWAMMIAGLGFAGAMMRRRATKIQFA